VRISPVPAFIFLALVAALVGGWQMFARTESGRYEAARTVAHSRSEIRLELTMTRRTGPIAEESYRMTDNNGVSAIEYRATSRTGTTVRVDSPARKTKETGSDVAYLFGQVVQDGIWELNDRPARGDTSTTYTLYVWQLVSGQQGQRRITFTDPHYWASTGGHQFHITLDKNKPVPDLVQLKSTALIEPRYEKLVADFLSFGSPAFRATVAAQRARLAARR
jgi:hypothetical protein